jgi:hypothetical protein
LDEKGTDDIIGGSYGAFGFTVLRRSVWAGETEYGANGKKKGAICGIIEFPTVVTLEHAYSFVKVCTNNAMKQEKHGGHIRFENKGESPPILRKMVNNDKVIFVDGYTGNKRRPKITARQHKVIASRSIRYSKGDPNIFAQFTCMT